MMDMRVPCVLSRETEGSVWRMRVGGDGGSGPVRVAGLPIL